MSESGKSPVSGGGAVTQQNFDLEPAQAVAFAARLEAAGHDAEAERIARMVIEVDPRNPPAHNLLGLLLCKRGAFYEALYRFDRALAAAPNWPCALSNRGMALGELGHHDEAVGIMATAANDDPNNPILWNNLGNTLERVKRYPEALAALDRTLKLDPNHMLSYYNRGIVLCRLNRHEEAIANFNKALERDPSHADSYYNRGVARLLTGDYARGWPDYEWRQKTNDQERYYFDPMGKPQWDGRADIAGKTILIHAEQGIGDSINFMRYLPLVLAKGAHVLLVTHKPIERLAYNSFAMVEVLSHGDTYKAEDFDCYIPLMSLPLVFGTTLANVPPPWDLSGYRQPRFTKPGMHVGVVWSGNWKYRNDEHRSIDLATFSRLLEVPDINFVSLQREVRQMDREALDALTIDRTLERHAENYTDMAGTASLVGRLDLVIAVDTAVAHLAASIGVPTWILIPSHGTDWRWGRTTVSSPWYPQARLIRQAQCPEGTWADTVTIVASQLRALAQQAAA